MSPDKQEIYIEIGKKRVFTRAVEWLRWCRSERAEKSVIQALLDSGPRYSQILQSTELGFKAPEKASSFNIIERLNGNATTDFGAPDVPLSRDIKHIDTGELHRF
jgi:hypothetical protein